MFSDALKSTVALAVTVLISVACNNGQPPPALTSTPAPTALSESASMATPTPTSEPTPEPTEAPTSASGPTATSPGSMHTCDLQNTPYDTFATISSPEEEWRYEMRHSGPDRHDMLTVTAPDGKFIGKSEAITKDGTRYSRESTPDKPEVYGEWRIVGTDLHGSVLLPCLDPSTFDANASAFADEPHLTAETFLSEREGTMRNEFWADSTGRPTRSRRTFLPPDYDEVTNAEVGVVEFTYSGYGEPNIIEAPCARAAPDEAENLDLMRDCIYLLELKDTLSGTAILNWSLDVPLSSWNGVQVRGSPARVTQLILESRGLSGMLPWKLVWLDGLEHLWLSDNQLTGEIPADLGRSLTDLRTLTLDHNQLTGEIPAELSRLANLHILTLGNNEFTGCISPALRNVYDHDLDSLGLKDCESP